MPAAPDAWMHQCSCSRRYADASRGATIVESLGESPVPLRLAEAYPVATRTHPPARAKDSAMPLLANYGHEIAATTLAVQQLLAPAAPLVTTRTLNAARRGVDGGSVNLFLYRDQFATFRSGNDPDPRGQLLAELHYLVTAFAADDADTDAASHRSFGAARTAIEEHPVLIVPLDARSGGQVTSMQVRLAASALPLSDLTSLWIASQSAFALSFSFTASLPLLRERASDRVDLSPVTSIAGPGVIAVFGGPDTAAKTAAAASVAQELGGAVVSAPLGEAISPFIDETEANLRRLFDRAESGGAVLVIDEADALFGDRTVVSSGHDRYEGVELERVFELLVRAPRLVIIMVGTARPELAERADVQLRFPPDEP
jgi:hypothetical protein